MFKKNLFLVDCFSLMHSQLPLVSVFWAYNLNTQLAQTRTDYQALQSDYDQLDSDFLSNNRV